jgi:hypothetical protein
MRCLCHSLTRLTCPRFIAHRAAYVTHTIGRRTTTTSAHYNCPRIWTPRVGILPPRGGRGERGVAKATRHLRLSLTLHRSSCRLHHPRPIMCSHHAAIDTSRGGRSYRGPTPPRPLSPCTTSDTQTPPCAPTAVTTTARSGGGRGSSRCHLLGCTLPPSLATTPLPSHTTATSSWKADRHSI